jgi:hypothetical protein
MADNFDKILDECIDRINRGETPEGCLTDYPEYMERLKPLLMAMLQTGEAYSFAPSASAKRAARQRFNAALERADQRRLEKPPFLTRLFARPVAWASVTVAVLLILAVSYFGLRPAPYSPVPVPNPEGNFVFLISDEVNAIGDFESLNVSISKIGLQLGDDSGESVEFEPQVEEVDLTLVPGDKTQEIWRGNVPEGQYAKVFIQVTEVRGVLKETGETVEIKLPSQKLRMSKPFQVTAGTVTSFTYDLTVIATGNPQSGIKYLLKPQIGESGADQKPSEGKGRGKTDNTGANKPS